VWRDEEPASRWGACSKAVKRAEGRDQEHLGGEGETSEKKGDEGTASPESKGQTSNFKGDPSGDQEKEHQITETIRKSGTGVKKMKS